MKKYLYYLILLLLTGLVQNVGAQHVDPAQQQALNKIAKTGSTPQWLRLSEQSKFTAADFFTQNKLALGISEAETMQLQRTETDALGATHHRYQQYLHGYPMCGAEYILHEKAGRVVTANGKLANASAVPAMPTQTLTEGEALTLAIEYAPSKKFLWLDKKACAALSRHQGQVVDPNPTGALVWVALQEKTMSQWVLTWRFDIRTTDGQSEQLFVSATDGSLVKRLPISIHCDPGTGVSTWNGTVNINTDQSGPNFILLDDCQTPNVHVLNGNDSTSPGDATEYTDADNNWTGQRSAIQTFFGVEQTRQYYQSRHSRNSYDGGGATIVAYNQAAMDFGNGPNVSNACFDCISNSLTFGDDGTDVTITDDWNTIDIVGHEFTHGVTKFSAGLSYINESGALNESFSDIFGEMVELFTNGTADWLVGADRGAIRSMSNPSSFSTGYGGNMPDTYLGPNWYTGSSDVGGVHHNSSVQNFWFFLLANGGSGTNDNGDTYNVSGIGAVKAAQIAYANLTQQLVSNSDYNDAKNGSIAAAIDLFGECSNELQQCVRAWNAVGVNSQDDYGYDITADCSTINAAHGVFVPVHLRAFNDLTADCGMVANGTLVEFEAGHAVVLKPGFRSGDQFHAYINLCDGTKPPVINPEETGDDRGKTIMASAVRTNDLQVYPNPSTGHFSVQLQLHEADRVTIQILDLTGKTVVARQSGELPVTGQHTFVFDETTLLPGVYFIRAQTEAGTTMTQRLVIQ